MSIKAIIFDLDNTIYATKTVGKSLFLPVVKAIKENNDGFLSKKQLKKIEKDIWVYNFDLISKKYSFPSDFYDKIKKVFSTLEINKTLKPFSDFRIVKEIPCLKFLVTSGARTLQLSKIEKLGISHYFNGIFIDPVDEPENFKGKEQIFHEICEKNNLDPSEIVIVGDDASSEIIAGNNLGMLTIQLCKKTIPAKNASYHIKNFKQLKKLISKWNS